MGTLLGRVSRVAGLGGWMVMVLIGLAVVGALVVIALWRLSAPPEGAFDEAAQADSLALHTDILKRRASSEMDREDYLQRLSDLSER
jgi:hypothetical protein